MKRDVFKQWVLDALRSLGGKGQVLDVSKRIWLKHEPDLREGDLFYTWQYDIRWAAKKLRDEGKIQSVKEARRPMGACMKSRHTTCVAAHERGLGLGLAARVT